MAIEQLSYWIESSQTWTCPKTGVWKVICVGGGASGGLISAANHGNTVMSLSPAQITGGTTSFGSYLSAQGAQKTDSIYAEYSIGRCSGYNGYTGVANNLYGTLSEFKGYGSSSLAYDALKGVGYGAGGGSKSKYFTFEGVSSNITLYALPGLMGKIKSAFFNIDKGQQVACTIGAGGKASSLTSSILCAAAQQNGAKPTGISTEGLALFKQYILDGRDGLICLEYMD